MDHALRDALMIEVEDFLAEVRILQQHWPACPLLEAVLVVRDRDALLRGEYRNVAFRCLVRFATITLWLGKAFGNGRVSGNERGLLGRFA